LGIPISKPLLIKVEGTTNKHHPLQPLNPKNPKLKLKWKTSKKSYFANVKSLKLAIAKVGFASPGTKGPSKVQYMQKSNRRKERTNDNERHNKE